MPRGEYDEENFEGIEDRDNDDEWIPATLLSIPLLSILCWMGFIFVSQHQSYLDQLLLGTLPVIREWTYRSAKAASCKQMLAEEMLNFLHRRGYTSHLLSFRRWAQGLNAFFLLGRSMNQSILRTSSVLLITLLTCNMIARAEKNAAASLPAWSVNPKFASKLGDEFDGDWFTIRPPKELEQVDVGDTTAYDRAGIKIAVWMKETGRSANPTITIMSLPAPPPDKQNSHEFFTGFLKSVTAKWANAKGSKVSEGLWNDRPALRSRFSATAENGEAVRGAVLCASDDSATFAVCVMNSGEGDEETDELMTLENSAISCKQKLSRAP